MNVYNLSAEILAMQLLCKVPHLSTAVVLHWVTLFVQGIKEYTAIASMFTLHTLRRWPNGAVVVQITLARNPEGSGIETNNGTPNKVILTTCLVFNLTASRSKTKQCKAAPVLLSKRYMVHSTKTLQAQEVTKITQESGV